MRGDRGNRAPGLATDSIPHSATEPPAYPSDAPSKNQNLGLPLYLHTNNMVREAARHGVRNPSPALAPPCLAQSAANQRGHGLDGQAHLVSLIQSRLTEQGSLPYRSTGIPRDLASADLLPSQAVVADGDRAFVCAEAGQIAVLALTATRLVSRE